jgi:hypothetical protein
LGAKKKISGKSLNEMIGMDWALNGNGRKGMTQNRKC